MIMGKLVTALISPLGTSLLLALIGLVLLSGRRWRNFGVVAGFSAIVWLYVWSTPIASSVLRGWIESQAGPRAISAIQPAPVMVVLGGGITGPQSPLRPDPDLGAAADRLWHAARLFHAGKAQRLVLSGGITSSSHGSEAAAMKRFLLDLGVPSDKMQLEESSVNTSTNAMFTTRLLKVDNIHTVILVTSALHMPRARDAFERAGLKITPAPTDFEVIDVPFDLLRIVPDADALQGSARAMKEIVGRVVGR